MANVEIRSRQKCFGGWIVYASHQAETTGCEMRFSVYLPPGHGDGPSPLVTWLSGLTCTEDNFTTKAGAYRTAAELGLMIVAPDTSPRGEGVADDEAYDMGQGAGFYLTATQQPWAAHYKMDAYVTGELPGLIAAEFGGDISRHGISGHSMGGHGALSLGLKNPDTYRSISAFSPIVAPMHCPWGQKAFSAYLGEDSEAWKAYDSCEIVGGQQAPRPEILVDVGLDDPFLTEQLMPERFEGACQAAGQPLNLRRHKGYDHSYFFIASFIDQHLHHHSSQLA